MKSVLLSIISCAFFLSVQAQSPASRTQEEKPVYLRFPTIPEFNLYRAPDSTLFTRRNLKKDKPVIFMIFSPECGHCQHETEEMIKNMDKLKGAQILMVTYLPFSEMVQFYKNYGLSRFSNIHVAYDKSFFFPTYFQVRNFPSFYIYGKNGKFKKFLEGAVPLDEIYAALKAS